jgi:hypothetical protein
MFLVTLDYPVEMMDFFALIFPLISFDAIPVDPLFEKMFKFSQITTDRALTDQFDNAGYSSLFIVKNIGSLFFISLFQIGLCCFLWVSRRFKPFERFIKIQSGLDRMANNALWNGMIQFYADNFLLFAAVSYIESTSIRFGTQYSTAENFCSVLAFLGAISSVVFPLFILILYWRQLRWVDPEKDRPAKIAYLSSEQKPKHRDQSRDFSRLRNDELVIMLL